MQIYSPQLDSPPPRWVNFAHGLLLFLYQVKLRSLLLLLFQTEPHDSKQHNCKKFNSLSLFDQEFVAYCLSFPVFLKFPARLLMLLMESKREGQILLVHWENFLTMVTFISIIIYHSLNLLLHSILLFIRIVLTVILT